MLITFLWQLLCSWDGQILLLPRPTLKILGHSSPIGHRTGSPQSESCLSILLLECKAHACWISLNIFQMKFKHIFMRCQWCITPWPKWSHFHYFVYSTSWTNLRNLHQLHTHDAAGACVAIGYPPWCAVAQFLSAVLPVEPEGLSISNTY